jgi:hypothetical protein
VSQIKLTRNYLLSEMPKKWFKTCKPRSLAQAEWNDLKVTGSGIQVTQALRARGAEASTPCATIVVTVENSQV